MPTGYTYDIENGQSFEDFALGCARAFGACLHQRDDSSKDKPKLREESSYYEEKLPEALAELGYLQSLTDAQIEEYGQQARDEEIASVQKSIEEKSVLREKYNAMLAKVGAWNPPTPDHQGLKEFMTKQIVESIDFDCNTKYYLELLQKAISKTPVDFYNDAVSKAEWNVTHYEEELEKEKTRISGANAWITELYKSLGIKLT
ncbi:hypothetical protein UFOVP447_113 [uncultured Caudovirales phage]|uniref:Uncharacterized protein n=1 Tax=uncultured Caudovirales phage TaxID=2100421 RepID=A0A6J5MBZ6_9CAUD|nr:hypothetical protein UFOVP447_113 [uncultured Caudovirales phage]